LAVGAVAVTAVGCQDPDADAGAKPADVYILLIRQALDTMPAPEDPDVTPVVYVVGVGEHEIGATVQANVVEDLREEADVRFADERDEALEETDDGIRVRDGGVLLAIGEVPQELDARFDVEVEIYRSEADRSIRVLTLADRSGGLTVTSSSVVAPD
jgi:hypothetical protein